MGFTNQNVLPGDIPRANDLSWTAMPPEHTREVRAQAWITVLFFFAVSTIPASLIPWPDAAVFMKVILPTVIALAGLLSGWLALKKVRCKGYALREHDLAFKSGLFFRRQVVLPFNRIQHAEVTSGPLQRHFGVASLKFFTAGGASVDVKLSGLLTDDAERLREHILSRSAAALEH